MPLVIGLDIGTTTITAIAVDESGIVRGSESKPVSDSGLALISKRPLRDDARTFLAIATAVLRQLADRLGPAAAQVVGLAITGQQHGCVLIDSRSRPRSPFVNWQDKRCDESHPAGPGSYLDEARRRVGADLPRRTGCRLASGYMASTLFRWKERGDLPDGPRAAFISDYVAARLTRSEPVTDPTLAASAGVFNLTTMNWDTAALEALALPADIFPPVRPVGTPLGRLRRTRLLNLPDVPVFLGLGDHQASFLGAVAEPENSLFINVGTGGQVAACVKEFRFDPALETRPFPDGGFELVSAGLTGGKVYATLESFFRSVGSELWGQSSGSLFAQLNALAARVPPGCDGLRCEPYFAGTRAEPNRTATWTGMTERNFTPGHMARAVLEGMARVLHEGAERIEKRLPSPRPILIGAGNGIRENPLFTRILAREFGRPVRVPHHREEAAYGAAIVAAVSTGILPDLTSAGSWIRYDEPLAA